MDKKDIEALITLMDQSSLSEIELSDEKFRIVLKKAPPIIAQPTMIPQTVTSLPPAVTSPVSSPVTVETTSCENLHVIKSPMVGTFYGAPSPDSEPFVKLGSKVDKDSVVCILEAMKVMNEIQADIQGTVREILVSNGQPVEFGQPLFKIEI